MGSEAIPLGPLLPGGGPHLPNSPSDEQDCARSSPIGGNYFWAKLVLEHRANERGSLRSELKPGPLPTLLPLDKPGVDQDREVMTHCRLASGNGRGQVAGTRLIL
jgi:hypothetical protein